TTLALIRIIKDGAILFSRDCFRIYQGYGGCVRSANLPTYHPPPTSEGRVIAGLPSALAESRRHPRMSRSHSKVVVCQAVQAEAKPVVTSSPKHAGADQPARVLSNAELETNKTVLGIILGGGAGTRLYPLTKKRAKPAVPLGANYRLIDIPVSNCLNSNITKMYCLTQFNSASLNRHLSQAYNSNVGGYNSRGFVEVLAASQSSQNKNWFQGTADAVRQYMWLFEEAVRDGVEDFLILSGDHLYRMDYRDFVRKHRESGAAITIAALPCAEKEATAFGLMKIDSDGKSGVISDELPLRRPGLPPHRLLSLLREAQGGEAGGMRVDTGILGVDAETWDAMVMGSDYYETLEECETLASGSGGQIINKEGVKEANREEQGWVIKDGIVVVIKDSVHSPQAPLSKQPNRQLPAALSQRSSTS
ncbi:hypothetical protein QJQ45_017220, partial [Haematococcus lacustris]